MKELMKWLMKKHGNQVVDILLIMMTVAFAICWKESDDDLCFAGFMVSLLSLWLVNVFKNNEMK